MYPKVIANELTEHNRKSYYYTMVHLKAVWSHSQVVVWPHNRTRYVNRSWHAADSQRIHTSEWMANYELQITLFV